MSTIQPNAPDSPIVAAQTRNLSTSRALDEKLSSTLDLQAALTFARSLAQDELSAIDRMHQRSVRYILAVISVLLIGGTIIGWIGFKNLKDNAISTARRQVQSETITQVREQLTREKVEGIVATQVEGFTRHQLTAEVNREINAGPLHDQILQNAREQSKSQLSLALAPRKLSQQQAGKLVQALKAEKEDYARLIFVTSLTYDVESQNYESQVTEAFRLGGFQFGNRNNLTTPDVFSYGVTIVYDHDYFEHAKDLLTPKRLLTLLQNAGVKATLFPGKEIDTEGETVKPVFTIWVAPRDISPTSADPRHLD